MMPIIDQVTLLEADVMIMSFIQKPLITFWTLVITKFNDGTFASF